MISFLIDTGRLLYESGLIICKLTTKRFHSLIPLMVMAHEYAKRLQSSSGAFAIKWTWIMDVQNGTNVKLLRKYLICLDNICDDAFNMIETVINFSQIFFLLGIIPIASTIHNLCELTVYC